MLNFVWLMTWNGVFKIYKQSNPIWQRIPHPKMVVGMSRATSRCITPWYFQLYNLNYFNYYFLQYAIHEYGMKEIREKEEKEKKEIQTWLVVQGKLEANDINERYWYQHLLEWKIYIG